MPFGSQPPDDLIAQVLMGDRASCEQFVRENYEGVYRFSLYLTSDTEMAADITQDTFRTAWQKLGEFNRRASIASWLHRIAYNRFIDVYRKRSRERSVHKNLQAEFNLNGDTTESSAERRNELSEYLSSVVRQLPEEQRTIVVLHYFEGLSLHETATVVDQAVGTVKWRLSKALTWLRSIVDPDALQERFSNRP